MKRIILLFIGVIASLIIQAQSSDYFNYQAIIRDATGNVKANANVSILIEILQGSSSGTTVFSETHAKTSNTLGMVDLKIGSINTTDFPNISWANGPYFLKVTLDGTVMGTSQLLSVPYALHAKSVESYSETDPIFIAHPVNGITATNISNWSTAFGWGNHASAGYLTSFTESDPIFGASAANVITSTNVTNWNTAFGWGNHATAGYLTSFTESDPIFGASAANGITSTNITNWNTVFGWGNHASAGYLTSFTETDPVWLTASASYYTKTNMQTSGGSQLHFDNITNKPTTLLGYGIINAMSTSHAANGITATNITDWNTAFGWGSHIGLYRPIAYVPAWSEITSNPFSFTSPGNNQLLKYNSTSSKWENWTPNYLTTETQSLTLNTNQLAIFGGNTVTFTNWDTDKTDDVTLATPVNGDMLYYNGTWTSIPKGTTGQVLTMNASGAPEWQSIIQSPTVITLAATFNLPTAILNATVNPNKLPTTVTFQYGITTTYGNSIVATPSPIDGSSIFNVSADVSGLVAGTLYHFRVRAENTLGVVYGDDMSFTLLGLGITWQGGLIFYLDNTGQHGLVSSSPTDQGTAEWGCSGTTITGGDGIIVGTGSQNTTDIINSCATVGIAARLCRSYTDGVYNDWFLPSKDELGLMYTNLHMAIPSKGGFGAVNYWSSSEVSSTISYKQNFSNGSAGNGSKSTPYSVRAVRAF